MDDKNLPVLHLFPYPSPFRVTSQLLPSVCGCLWSTEGRGRSVCWFGTRASRSLGNSTLSFSVLTAGTCSVFLLKDVNWSRTKSVLLPTWSPKVWKRIQPQWVKLPSQISTDRRCMREPRQVSRSSPLICRCENKPKCYCCMLHQAPAIGLLRTVL